MNSKSLYAALLVLLVSSVTWFSCKKDIKETPVTPGNENPIPASTPVTGSVSGIVVNENNAPVNGAEVKIGAGTVTTGADGAFLFKNLTLDKYISTVTINKAGYFKAIRSFSANATLNYVSIKLIPKTLAGTVNSDNPSVVNLSNGTTIALQSNSIVVKATGAAYSGQVNVYAAYIDPTSTDISTMVPGSFMGEDANNLYSLQSTGMIAVDLESTSGQALQLAGNMPATIKLAIPTSLQSKAPASIDTWSLDDRGVWQKEGTALKNGNAYDMQVTHFSFWNCDVPLNSTYLTIHLQDQDGNSLANTLITLTVPATASWWTTTSGYTDSLGNVSGVIPADIELEMNVYAGSYNCAVPLYTHTIGPFTTSSSITVTATLTSTQVITVTGSATDCNSQPIQNGTAIIYTGTNIYYTTITNGSYSIDVTHCGPITSVIVSVLDNSTGAQNSSGNVTVTGNTVTIPTLSACGSGSQTAIFAMGTSQGFCEGNLIGTYTTGVALTGNNMFMMLVNVTGLGTYNISTAPVNGISFVGTGTFTFLGQQEVGLVATGTPVDPGSFTFATQSTGVTGCTFSIYVYAPPAQIDIGPTAGSCANVTVNGTYMANAFLNSSNTVSVTLDVLSPGSYSIYANSGNGYSFADSGIVTTTGAHTFILTGNGLPTVPGTDVMSLNMNGMVGCTFPVQVLPGTGGFTLDGAPGQCNGAITMGNFIAGAPMDATNIVMLNINVTVPVGVWLITTNTTNGMTFGASVPITTTGPQTITLYGSGTPLSAGTYTFQVDAGTVAGCFFTAIVN